MHLLFLMQVIVNDLLQRREAIGIADEKGGQGLLTDFHQVRGVGAVVAADDKEHVHGLAQHVEECILALLGGTANGIEHQEIFGMTIALFDRLTDAFLDFLSFALEHRGLIRHADAAQVKIGIEAGRNGIRKFL